jgi:hypothetical protein
MHAPTLFWSAGRCFHNDSADRRLSYAQIGLYKYLVPREMARFGFGASGIEHPTIMRMRNSSIM